MADFKKQLLNVLSEIKGSGSFVVNDAKPFVFPGLTIRGAVEIGFPVNAVQANEIIKVAHKAPFGKGSETVLDNTVRSAWEIDAGEISFANNNWGKFITGITEQIKPALGIEEYAVTANLYKLLIYETGDFFLPHKDSEKEQGMFGTLIVGLPSKHTGGELLVKFDGRQETIDFSGPAGEYKIPFAAFYADCEHEIKPVTAGHRVCLVYNLIQTKGKEKIALNPFLGYAKRMATILKACEEDKNMPKIVLLGHQYTPANFTMDALKLNDRPKAEALIQAAQMAGFYAKLGLVTSYQTGELVPDLSKSSAKSRRRGYYDDNGDEDLEENGTMGEIFDEHIEIEHWMEDGLPPLRNIQFDEKYLISALTLNEGEPIEKEAEGYTGNAGMEMQYWYHYGAVFLWPKKYHGDVLATLEPANQLEWLGYYNNRWNNLTQVEMTVAKQLAGACMQATGWRKPDFNPLVDWLVNIADAGYMQNKALGFLITHFKKVTVEAWLKLFAVYPYNHFEEIFTTAALSGKPEVTRHILDVLAQLSAGNAVVPETFIQQQIEQIPAWLNAVNLYDKDEQTPAKEILRNVLIFAKLKSGDSQWQQSTAGAFTRVLTREYVNDVLLATILEIGETSPVANQIMAVCKIDLRHRVGNKPQPPADWSRPMPEDRAGNKKVWNILKEFLQSPTLQVFDYAKVQALRSEMENVIYNVTVDLKMETIKKGSPHTLRLTKTQDAYKRELAKWKTDAELLEKAEKW